MSRRRSATMTVACGRNTSWRRRSVAPSEPDAPSTEAIAAQRDDAVDVRDPGRSDPVLHAPVCSLDAGGARPIAEVVSTVADLTCRARDRTGRACDALETIPGRERPALQSVRRSLSYAIASAATCAPPEVGFCAPSATHPPPSRDSSTGSTRPSGTPAELTGEAPDVPGVHHRDRAWRAPTEVDRESPGRPIGGGNWMKVTRLAALAGVAVIALGTVGMQPGCEWRRNYKIGIDMPQQGSELAGSSRDQRHEARAEAGRRQGRQPTRSRSRRRRSSTTPSTACTTRRPARRTRGTSSRSQGHRDARAH